MHSQKFAVAPRATQLRWSSTALLLILCGFLVGCGRSKPTLIEGNYATVTDKIWCVESKAALGEIQDWAVRGNTEEVSRVFRSRGVATLEPNDTVKVLDLRFGGSVKVRNYQGKDCWTVATKLESWTDQSKSSKTEPALGSGIPRGNSELTAPANSPQAPVPSDIPNDVTYKIVKTDVIPGVKRGLVVMLNRKISEDVLRSVATKLKNSDPGVYERTLILYYLPGMKPGAGAWATTFFDPDLEVRILGLSADQEQSLVSKTTDRPSQTAIGKWLDEGLFGVIRIYRETGTLYFEMNAKDGSSGRFEVVERSSSLGRRFEDRDGSDAGDHYVIDGRGNLQLRDREGLIRTAKRIP